MIPKEDELHMDLYNVSVRRYQDNLGCGVTYTNMHLDILMQHMDIQRPNAYPVTYLYVPSWNELWH